MSRRATTDDTARINVQGTCVALGGVGLLLRGPPGSGKSDLALRLIDGGAALVADDLTEVTRQGGALTARLPAAAPPETSGRLEVRGLGLMAVPTVESAPLGLVVELTPQAEIERLPEPRSWICLGIALPAVALDPLPASAAAKLRLVVRGLPGFIMPPP
jgi:serine kinase of HPr protein (carbohydrate metabolism regulator)